MYVCMYVCTIKATACHKQHFWLLRKWPMCAHVLNELALAPAKATAGATGTATAAPDVLGAQGQAPPFGGIRWPKQPVIVSVFLFWRSERNSRFTLANLVVP